LIQDFSRAQKLPPFNYSSGLSPYIVHCWSRCSAHPSRHRILSWWSLGRNHPMNIGSMVPTRPRHTSPQLHRRARTFGPSNGKAVLWICG